MTTSVELQGQIGSEERLTGDITGPDRPEHVSPPNHDNGNGAAQTVDAERQREALRHSAMGQRIFFDQQ